MSELAAAASLGDVLYTLLAIFGIYMLWAIFWPTKDLDE